MRSGIGVPIDIYFFAPLDETSEANAKKEITYNWK